MAPSFDTCGWLARDPAMLSKVGDVLLPDEGEAEPSELVIAADMLELVDHGVREPFAALFAALGIAKTVRLLGDLEAGAVVKAFWPLMSRQLWNSNGVWYERVHPVLAPGLEERFVQASRVTAADFQAADAVRRRLSRALDALLRGNVIALFPTTHAPPPRRNSSFEVQMSYRGRTLELVCPASMGRLPQLVVPAVHVDGAHVGLSLVAGFGRDRMLLSAARRLDDRIRSLS
jgi:amidase